MAGNEDEWVFGYGSLMWNPGFPHAERQRATLDGYHRSFCIYSHHYRGTPASPGLVLGLDTGGACRGMAFRVTGADWPSVVTYLDERELIGYAYRPVSVPLVLDDGRRVDARTYVADHGHDHYAGSLPADESLRLILEARGVSGSNHDYAVNLIRELDAHGFSDDHLHALLARVRTEATL
jgi:cation transport protein ChaC